MGKKIALLDADYISKTTGARDYNDGSLLDYIIGMPDYVFHCHAMVIGELTKRNDHAGQEMNRYIADTISQGKIKIWTDIDILKSLSKYYGQAGSWMYVEYLKLSCAPFGRKYFTEHFGSLASEELHNNPEAFLEALHNCDSKVEHRKSLGEKKTFILLQLLHFLHGEQIYVFCSDDGNARKAVVGVFSDEEIDNINCLSVLGTFWLMKESGMSKEEVQIYYDRFVENLEPTQKTFKVWEYGRGSNPDRVKLPFNLVFDQIFEGKMHLRRDGDLEYIGTED